MFPIYRASSECGGLQQSIGEMGDADMDDDEGEAGEVNRTAQHSALGQDPPQCSAEEGYYLCISHNIDINVKTFLDMYSYFYTENTTNASPN